MSNFFLSKIVASNANQSIASPKQNQDASKWYSVQYNYTNPDTQIISGDTAIAGVRAKTVTYTSTIINATSASDFYQPYSTYNWSVGFTLPSDLVSIISCNMTTKLKMPNSAPNVQPYNIYNIYYTSIRDTTANIDLASMHDFVSNYDKNYSRQSSNLTPSGARAGDQCRYTISTYDSQVFMTAIQLSITITYSLGIPTWTSIYANARFANALVSLTPTQTILCFPVMGIYNITLRIRPSYSSVGAGGQANSPFFTMIKYLGVTYYDIGTNNRLAELDTVSGSTTTNNTSSDSTISFTGLFFAGDQIGLWCFNTANSVTVSLAPGQGTTFTNTLLQPLHSNATTYSSITLNCPNPRINFEQLRYFSGATEVTPFAVASWTGLNGTNGTFNSDMYGANATFTATFAIPQAVTSVWYRPHPNFVCNSYGNTLSLADTNAVSRTTQPMMPPICPTAYFPDYNSSVANYDPNNNVCAPFYMMKYNIGDDEGWTYGYSTDTLNGNLTFLIVGDTTSYGNDQWVFQLAQWMKNMYTEHSILYYVWDNTLNQYANPVTLGDLASVATISIYNASVTGGFANGLLASNYLTAVNNINPNFIWWNHGKSYATNQFSTAIVKGELASAFAQIQVSFPNVPTIVTLQPPNRDDTNYTAIKTIWNSIITQFGAANIYTIDIFTLFNTANKPTGWYKDNFTPSPLGVTQWVNAITAQWTTIMSLPAPSWIPALNVVSNDQYLFDASQSGTRYGDFNVVTGNTTPAGWTSNGTLTVADFNVVAANALTNSIQLKGSGTQATYLQRSVSASVLTALKGQDVYLTWLSKIQTGSAATVGRVGLSYNSTASGVVTTKSRTRTDIQGGYIWQNIGPISIPTDATYVLVLLYHDDSVTPDSTHSVIFQQVLLTSTVLPSTLYALPISTAPYSYPNWQIAFNVPNGQDVAGLGEDDFASTPDAIKRAIQRNWDGYMTIINDNGGHNYYDAYIPYNHEIQGTSANDGTFAETYRSKYAHAGHLNWTIIFFGIRDASVLYGNKGYKWIDPNFPPVTGTLSVNLTPAQAVAAIHALNTVEVYLMNYNSVTGAYELIRPKTYYIPDTSVVKIGNFDLNNYCNVSGFDSEGFWYDEGYQFQNEGHMRRTMRKFKGCIGAVVFPQDNGALATYFKQDAGGYGFWRDKAAADNDPNVMYYAADLVPSPGNNLKVLCTNGTTVTIANTTYGPEAAAKAAGTISAIQQTFLYPDVRIIYPPRYWNFRMKSFVTTFVFSQPTATNAPINRAVAWLPTLYSCNINGGFNYPNSPTNTMLTAQAIPGCGSVVRDDRRNFFAKPGPINGRNGDYVQENRYCTFYSPYTIQGTFTQYVGLIFTEDDGTVRIVISPPGTFNNALPLKYKVAGAADSTLQDATFNVTYNFPDDGSGDYTLANYPADQRNFRLIYYFIGSNCPNQGALPVAFRYDSNIGFNWTTRAWGPLVANGPTVYGRVTYLTTI